MRPRVAREATPGVDWKTVVGTLNEDLGTSITSLIAQVAPGVVRQWSQPDEPSDVPSEAERRLRDAFVIYTELVLVDSPETVQAWFLGSNPYLGGASPAELLAAGESGAVFAAARAFRDLG